MHCDPVKHKIIGHDIQVVEIELDPEQTVIAEAGTMTYVEEDITFKTRMGDGTEGFIGRLFSAGKRKLTGESVFLTHFTNTGQIQKRVAFAAPYPGSIIRLDMAQLGEEIVCQKDSFLVAAFGTQVDVALNKRLGTGFFGGEGFILQRLKGDGLAFIHAGGTVIQKDLNNETLRLDTGCLVAFTHGIDYRVKMNKSLKSMLFGGEGLFLATLKGTGTVWIQSLPFSRLADRILEHAPSVGGREAAKTEREPTKRVATS